MSESSTDAARATKLASLVGLEGYDDETEFLGSIVEDSVAPGICMNPGCNYSCAVEPDQDQGWCEACDTNTVTSALVLAGLI
jgi:hypothetical protein